jgi:hypothetical protein
MNYLIGFFSTLNQYSNKSLTKINKFLFDTTNPNYDESTVRELFQKLFYQMNINLYGTFFSDNDQDWIYYPYYFEKYGSNFNFAFRYENGYFWVKIDKIIGLLDYFSTKELNWLKLLREHEFILVEKCKDPSENNYNGQNLSEIQFKKWIGNINLGYEDLFDRINYNVKTLFHYFKAKMNLVKKKFVQLIIFKK